MQHTSLSDRLVSVALALLVFSCMTGWSVAHAENYTLVPEDQVRLRVVEWRSSDSRYASWEALDGTYAVDDAGNLSIPIAGQVQAIGKTTQQVADAIAGALSEKAELPGKPFIALEIAQHAPIFVTGTVQTPGRYAFEADMTVMKAVSIAGGFLRDREENTVFERDRIQAAGAYRTAILNRRDLLMRQARLRAEIAGEQSFEIPAELVGTPDVDKLKAQELNLMRLRRVDIQSQIDAASDLARLYGQQVESLEAKINSQKRQIDLAQKELDNVNSLVSKGLVSNSRQVSVDRWAADAQGTLIDLEVALTTARQGLSEADRSKINIANRQNSENQELLNQVNLAIGRAAIDIQVAQLLGEQAGYSAQLAQMNTDMPGLGRAQKNYRIVRRNDDGTYRNIEADETTTLRPHDVVEIGIDTDTDLQTPPPPLQLQSAPQQQSSAVPLSNVAGDNQAAPGWISQTGAN
ncbi:exopolysaccharide production protein ExoF [Rhizobium sp. BK226]|jgi:exopolysaccharide production protein ExoF|uniref:polysaccharide biosynthesis/export family protein n=1 Tax=Rhizobium TaxID=379 RepID=UPI00040DB7BE|nr:MULTISPECIES: polysaccharide biosynthesis/export family protein [Rhizobium]KZS53691.1 exopolysaccharide biosynthesis protein [Rhizobium anhuiense bv. trifolii]MBB3296351.1 exopolysaccharide production protein ExoF [Rhizobium sp. BK112]MBB3365566.1 exopolysaccharide production protein ExoF [Rhizobium sp. BK077]MBB3740544.1 exopolysaccharide production protein ExoF [Rhizobium sp. BK591]MBB4111750.1 exopolysaccharide production protein ExoF [Rhizobium sp. BK226]